jgi:hypothetical protein
LRRSLESDVGDAHIERFLNSGHDALDMVLDFLRDPKAFGDSETQKIKSLPVGVVRSRKQLT